MPNKIAFVLKGYPRVSETFIAQEIYLLEQKGYEIEIFSMRQAREPQRQPIVEKINAPITYVPEYIRRQPGTIFFNNVRCFLGNPPTYFFLFCLALIRSLLSRKKDPIKRFLQAGWLVTEKNLLKNKEYHLHSHFIHAPTEMTRYICQLTGLKYSISAHAKDIYTIPESQVIDRIDHSEFLSTCTRFNYEFLNKLQLKDPSKVHLTYHGIDTEVFKPSKEHCLTTKSPFLLSSVGRLVEKKGYDIILAALRMLKEEGYSFQYDVFGQGDLKESVEKMIADFGLQKEVKLHFTATHPQIIKRFESKGIFLCGSRITGSGDRDGIPNTVAEAMSMELPVIATRVSGLPELIQHKVSGYLIPSEDAIAMKEAILELIQNPEETEKMSKQGRLRVKEFFNASVCIHDIDRLLEKCLQ